MNTFEDLNEASTLLDADELLINHSNNISEKVSGIHLKESVLTVISELTAGTALEDTDIVYVKKSNADLRKLTGAQIKAEVLGSISGLTAASGLADTDIVFIKDSSNNLKKLTGAQVKSEVLGSISGLTASTELNDTDIFLIKDSSNNLKKLTGALIKSSSGANDAPLGSIMSYYGTNDPTDGKWLICDGRDTTGTAIELETNYPSLYMFLGGTNVLPEIFDHSRPSAWETITGVQVGYEMPYDGIITASGNWNATGNIGYIAIDGVTVGSYGHYPSGTQNVASGNTITVKKGQKITAYVWASQVTWKASWYKSHKIIKAVSSVDVYHAPANEIAQIEQYVDNGLQNAESYSTTETLTGGKWIDGKPIYRKVWTGLSVGVSSGTWQSLNLTGLPSIDNFIKGVAIRSATGDKYVYNFISFRWNNSDLYYKSTNAENAITDVIIEYTKTTD